MRLIDRDIAVKACRYYAACLGLAFTLLLLENIPRVVAASARLADPVTATMLVLIGLLPEYAAIAGFFGIYLSAAYLAYRLVRRNELAAWSAAGISPLRMTAALSALALFNALMMFVMLGWLQPLGAKAIAILDQEVAVGHYGFSLESGEPAKIGDEGTIMFDHVDAGEGLMRGVLLRLPQRTISAQTAQLHLINEDSVRIDLRNGLIIEEARSRGPEALQFRSMSLTVPNSARALTAIEREPFQVITGLTELVTIAVNNTDRSVRAVAWSEALYRITLPLLAVLIAWLGFTLGHPGRTESSTIAVLLGAAVAVLCLRLADVGRSGRAGDSVVWFPALLIGVAAICWIAGSLNRRLGNGFIDHFFVRRILQIRSLISNRNFRGARG